MRDQVSNVQQVLDAAFGARHEGFRQRLEAVLEEAKLAGAPTSNQGAGKQSAGQAGRLLAGELSVRAGMAFRKALELCRAGEATDRDAEQYAEHLLAAAIWREARALQRLLTELGTPVLGAECLREAEAVLLARRDGELQTKLARLAITGAPYAPPEPAAPEEPAMSGETTAASQALST